MEADIKAWRDQIAAAVRSVSFWADGGTCALRMAMGHLALTHLGLKPRPVIGGMVFRAGPDEMMDTVPFCGGSNYAEIVNGRPLFHMWLDVDGDIVDFSCGDWEAQESLIGDAGGTTTPDGQPLRPIQWDAKPPRYIWRPARTLAGEMGKPPPIGTAWYRAGFRIPVSQGGAHKEAELNAMFQRSNRGALETVKPFWPQVRDLLPDPIPLSRQPTRAEARRLRQMEKIATRQRPKQPAIDTAEPTA